MQEMILAAKASEAQPTESRAKAEANFKKEERAREGAQAMLDYLANGREVRENMAKLKALRLAREAAEEAAGPSEKVAKKVAAKVTTKLTAAVAEKGAAKVKKPRALKRTQQ